jgi:hypothetical protein
MKSVMWALLVIAPACAAQTLPPAKEIIAKYVAALGGEEALKNVKTRGARGSLASPTFGTLGRYEEIAAAPDRMLRTFRIDNYGVTQRAVNGSAGWTEDPEFGFESIGGVRLEEMRRDAEFYLPLNFGRFYESLTTVGKEEFEGRPAYRISARRGGISETFWFDSETGLMAGVEWVETARNGVKQTVRMNYEDYRPVNGVQVAHTLRLVSPSLIWIVRRGVAHNVPLEAARFEKP